MLARLAAGLFIFLIAVFALLGGAAQAGDNPTTDDTATAKGEVEDYDSPVEPRKVVGTLSATAGSSVLEYHPHGWCRLALEAFGLGQGWIAQDHLNNCPPSGAVPGAPMGKLVAARNDVDIFDRPEKPRKVVGTMRASETAKVVGVNFVWWQRDLPATDDFAGGKGTLATKIERVRGDSELTLFGDSS